MTLVVHVLDSRVVGVLVRDKVGGLDVAAVGVLPLPVEDLIVQVNVVVVDGIVKGDGDHLGHVLAVGTTGADLAEVSGHLGAILRAEAVGQLADGGVTGRGPVGIGLNVTGVLVRAIVAVLLSVTEEAALNAVAVTAGEVVLLADGLVGEEQGLDLLLLGLGVAVLDGGLPVAGLLLNVEGQAGGTADGLETLKRERTSIPHTFF